MSNSIFKIGDPPLNEPLFIGVRGQSQDPGKEKIMKATRTRKAALKALFYRNDGQDLRTTAARRKRALVEAYLNELPGPPSAADLSIIEAAASLRLELERIERRALKGAPLPRDYCTLSKLLDQKLERIRSRPAPVPEPKEGVALAQTMLTL